MKKTILFRLLEAIGLGLLVAVAFMLPFRGLGLLESGLLVVFALLIMRRSMDPEQRMGWLYLAMFIGVATAFYWMPGTIKAKGNLDWPTAGFAGLLFFAYESFGIWLTWLFARHAYLRTRNAWATAFAAGFATLAWEFFAFHVYEWSWSAPMSALPFLARSGAFLGAYGISATLWAFTAYGMARRQEGMSWLVSLRAPMLYIVLLAGLSAAWYALPREAARVLDVVMVQPNFVAGARWPGMEKYMEEELWRLSDRALQENNLPKPERATLLVWPESSVLGRDDRLPSVRLQMEAQRRGIAWLFGTEGGLLNLVRGEAPEKPSFIQAKIYPMPFGERMPGPPSMRHWMDHTFGFYSQEPGDLSSNSSFTFSTPQGEIKVHSLICSEATMPLRCRDGLAMAGGQLLANLTNDGWFERSPATNLHASEIRLRAVELGVPMLRCTLTGKSGIARENGEAVLWGEPMTQGTYVFSLAWNSVRTPARSPWIFRGLVAFFLVGTVLFGIRKAERP
ncbi:MAG: apolipoprotein N-acyltransferase [Holophagaceae bacterium]|nr:apolipoprotein N-acyltransferase [Holophagaceae bacterium]